MKKVICDGVNLYGCDELCGGKTPHYFDFYECREHYCPFAKETVKCIPVEENI